MATLKKFDQFFKRKPKYRLVLVIALTTIVQLIINLVKHQNVFPNMEFPLSLIIMSGICGLLYVSKLSQIYQFIIAFSLTFTFLTLQMMHDGSYVNYTSLIIGGVLAVFLSLMILLGVWSIGIQKNS